MFLTYPSVDAVTIATFPSSLRLAAAVELILIALKVPKHNLTLKLRSVIFQAFIAGFRVRLEISSPAPPLAQPTQPYRPNPSDPNPNHRDVLTRYVRRFPRPPKVTRRSHPTVVRYSARQPGAGSGVLG